jgi:hypothetical protein
MERRPNSKASNVHEHAGHVKNKKWTIKFGRPWYLGVIPYGGVFDEYGNPREEFMDGYPVC